MRAIVSRNIMKPGKLTESASNYITEKIVPIFLGAAAMALIIVLLGLVLGVMYYTNWRRCVNYFVKQSLLYFFVSNCRMKCSKSHLKARRSSHHQSLGPLLPKQHITLYNVRVRDVRNSGFVCQEESTKDWLLEQRVCRSRSGSGENTKHSDASETRGNTEQFLCDKKNEYCFSHVQSKNELCICNSCTDCPTFV
jgi:hypothetical protein